MNEKIARLSDEQLTQVSGGAVGDQYNGWPCQYCGSTNTITVCTEDYDADPYPMPPYPAGTFYHITSCTTKCNDCGQKSESSEKILCKPKKSK